MKKRRYYIAILTVCSLVLLSGCGKKNSKNNHSYNSNSNYTPSTVPVQTTTTAPANAPKVNMSNLVITAGSEIDYMSAIESVENMDLSKSMVSINSANVDRFTPGNYTVYYTFDYMGQTVKSFIVVTVLENTEETTIPSESNTETSSTDDSEQSSENSTGAEGESSSGEETSNTGPSNEENSNGASSSETNTESTSSENGNGALNSTVYHSDVPIPDAIFTLSTGETVTIKNTPERYIVETFTEDSYYTEDDCHYLRSELKVLMNTGEVQTVEMVITRVSGIPEENTSSSTE